MEPNDLKGLPFHHSYRVLGTIFVPMMLLMLLAIIGIDYRRSSAGLARLDLFAVAIQAVAAGVSYLRMRRVLMGLEVRLKEQTLSALWLYAFTTAIAGLGACITALALFRR
jgi:hypothetical protein